MKTLWNGMAVAAGAIALACGAASGAGAQTPAQTSAQTPAPVAATAPSGVQAVAAAYGSLPAYEQADISPNGQRLAYIQTSGEARNLLIIEPATGNLIGGSRVGDAKVRSIAWIDDDHVLVIMTSTEPIPRMGAGRAEWAYGEIYSVPDRQLRRALGGTPEVFPILSGQTFVRTINGRRTLFAQTMRFENAGYEGASLYQVDLDTGRGRKVFEWDRRTPDFVAGPDGQPIAAADYYADTGRWVLKARRGVGWPEIWSTTAPLDQPYLDGMGTALGTVVVHAARDGQPPRFHQVDVTTGEWSDLPFEGDPDALIRDPETNLVIGAAYTKGDEIERTFIDTNGPRARAARAIAATYPGRHPELVSASADMRQLVVQTWGDEDAGAFQIVDLEARSASELGAMYPAVTAVGEVRPIRYPAADGMMIPGYLTLPPGKSDAKGLPLVALVHGGPAARDNFGFDWWAQAMAAQGYAVLQANYRGSDGLGDAHREAGYGEWGAKMQTDVSDGVRWLASEGIVDPARVCIVGASYGGYAAMAGPTLDTGVYRCAVAVAGVSDLRTMVSWAGGGSGGRNPTVRYWTRFMGDEMESRSPRRFAAQADAPLLLIHGIDDTVVPFEQSRLMADALRSAGKPYELIRLNGEDHWLSRGETRTRMLADTLRWLETYNPAN